MATNVAILRTKWCTLAVDGKVELDDAIPAHGLVVHGLHVLQGPDCHPRCVKPPMVLQDRVAPWRCEDGRGRVARACKIKHE